MSHAVITSGTDCDWCLTNLYDPARMGNNMLPLATRLSIYDHHL